mmetsp:Transcript_30320/g.45095  ORF Transcript_30320/g.45095 Transcript_30320/m.45095 type:complete len:189 (-) Transcript_30320:1658-2224(-)
MILTSNPPTQQLGKSFRHCGVTLHFFLILAFMFLSSSFSIGCAAESTEKLSSSCDTDGSCLIGANEDDSCVDKDEECSNWADNGDCATNPTFMIAKCPVSCQSCMDGPIEDPCENQHADCAAWASMGECKNNPQFMLSLCARSCGSCPVLDPQKLEEEEAECNDLHEMCGVWAERGECLGEFFNEVLF